VKTRSKPPKIIRRTKEPRIRLKRRGREGWMFFNPTIGTYQNKKMSKKRIKQVKTNSPIKILFWGLISNVSSQKVKLPAYPARTGHLPVKMESLEESTGDHSGCNQTLF
jgi:hypothetical protein